MRKRRSPLIKEHGGGSVGNGNCLLPGDLNDHQSDQHLTHHPHQHHSTLPPLSDAYEKSSREFEDIFDIDIDTLPPSFFAEALGSLIGESGESSLLNEDIFLDSCSSRCVKRCYSAPPSPLSGLLADFDEQGSMLDLINDTQNAVDNGGVNVAHPVSVDTNLPAVEDQPMPWASLSTNDVIDVLEGATQRLTAEQLQREAAEAVDNATSRMQQSSSLPTTLPRPPSAPPPTTHVASQPLMPAGSFSVRSDDFFAVDGLFSARKSDYGDHDWRQPRRPRSTVPMAASLIIPMATVRRHDIVRSRIASLATRRLRDKMNRASTSSDRSPLSISSDQFPYSEFEMSQHSSSSTPALMLTPQSLPAPSSLATLLNCGSNEPMASRSVTSIGGTSSGGSVVTNSTSSINGGDLYRCFYPTCSLSYDRPARLNAHLLHHVYGMTGPYRCDVPICSSSQQPAVVAAYAASNQTSTTNSNSSTSTTIGKISRTFPTTKQLWAHIESTHPEIVENKIQPVDFTALRHKAPLSCPSCELSFVYSFQLYLHLRQVHVRPSVRSSAIVENKRARLSVDGASNAAQQSTPFACRLCGFKSTTMSGLLLHIQRKQHQRQAARKQQQHPNLLSTANNNNNNGANSSNSVQSAGNVTHQPRIIFRGSTSFMLSHCAKPVATAKIISPPNAVPTLQLQLAPINDSSSSSVDATSAFKTLLVVNNGNGVKLQQPQHQASTPTSSNSSETTTTPPFYLLQRVVLVNVSH